MGDMTVDELKDKKLWFLWSAKPGRNMPLAWYLAVLGVNTPFKFAIFVREGGWHRCLHKR